MFAAVEPRMESEWRKVKRKYKTMPLSDISDNNFAPKQEWLPRRDRFSPDDRLIIADGQVLFYAAKEPYVASGLSILGALEYRSFDDKVRCHECGEWFKQLGTHSYHMHGISAREYRKRHGLKLKSALVGERLRSQQAVHMATLNRINGGTPLQLRAELRERANVALSTAQQTRGPMPAECRNIRWSCPAQMLAAIRALATELGRAPTVKDLEVNGLSVGVIKSSLNVNSLAQAMQLAEVPPNKNSHGRSGYMRELILNLGQSFIKKHGRAPLHSDIRRKIFPSYCAIRRHWVSLQEFQSELEARFAA